MNTETKQLKKCVIPVSGGMDSTVMLYDAFNSGKYDEIHCIFFNYHQKHIVEKTMFDWNIEELNYLRRTTNPAENEKPYPALYAKIIDISFLRELAPTSCLTNDDIEVPDGNNISKDKTPSSYVPNRNMILISIAASYAEAVGADEVYHGAVVADLEGGYWDCMPNFFTNLNNTFATANIDKPIKIITPLINMSKKDIILRGLSLGVDFKHTWTDYSGGKDILYHSVVVRAADANSASSKCRIQGFIDAGLIDPLPYQQDLTGLWKANNCNPIN